MSSGNSVYVYGVGVWVCVFIYVSIFVLTSTYIHTVTSNFLLSKHGVYGQIHKNKYTFKKLKASLGISSFKKLLHLKALQHYIKLLYAGCWKYVDYIKFIANKNPKSS